MPAWNIVGPPARRGFRVTAALLRRTRSQCAPSDKVKQGGPSQHSREECNRSCNITALIQRQASEAPPSYAGAWDVNKCPKSVTRASRRSVETTNRARARAASSLSIVRLSCETKPSPGFPAVARKSSSINEHPRAVGLPGGGEGLR
eukprot:7771612-Pyramimonas_sp.AAC.1